MHDADSARETKKEKTRCTINHNNFRWISRHRAVIHLFVFEFDKEEITVLGLVGARAILAFGVLIAMEVHTNAGAGSIISTTADKRRKSVKIVLAEFAANNFQSRPLHKPFRLLVRSHVTTNLNEKSYKTLIFSFPHLISINVSFHHRRELFPQLGLGNNQESEIQTRFFNIFNYFAASLFATSLSKFSFRLQLSPISTSLNA